MRYCPMCETYTARRECKACGMPTEPVPKDAAA
jgi:rRNA maturation protein Nop10